MRIYHGGTEIVENPRIIKTFTGRDFGVGFYTTGISEQATKWAKRQARFRRKPEAVLNTYELDDEAFTHLKVKDFQGYSDEWLDFVINCRSNVSFTHNYDLVIGKVANDDVGETIQAVLDGLTSREFALSKLVYMHANSQLCFSTEEALSHVRFLSAKRVD